MPKQNKFKNKWNPQNRRFEPTFVNAQMNKTEVKEPELLGYLIYRPDTDEFFHSHTDNEAVTINAYTKESALAYLFTTEHFAYRTSTYLDVITEIVPLFDFGDKLGVLFSE